jgi:hypothetical protein
MKKKFMLVWTLGLFCASLRSQTVFLKGSGIMTIGYASIGGCDLGLEVGFTKHLTAQVSYSYGFLTGDSRFVDRYRVTPQLRYYIQESGRDFYGGLVIPYRWGSDSQERSSNVYEKTDFNKWGGGLIAGWQLRIWKRFGIDSHLGYVAFYGRETVQLGTAPPQTAFKGSGAFIGAFTFYCALGPYR